MSVVVPDMERDEKLPTMIEAYEKCRAMPAAQRTDDRWVNVRAAIDARVRDSTIRLLAGDESAVWFEITFGSSELTKDDFERYVLDANEFRYGRVGEYAWREHRLYTWSFYRGTIRFSLRPIEVCHSLNRGEWCL